MLLYSHFNRIFFHPIIVISCISCILSPSIIRHRVLFCQFSRLGTTTTECLGRDTGTVDRMDATSGADRPSWRHAIDAL
jgi:hypothetical protein